MRTLCLNFLGTMKAAVKKMLESWKRLCWAGSHSPQTRPSASPASVLFTESGKVSLSTVDTSIISSSRPINPPPPGDSRAVQLLSSGVTDVEFSMVTKVRVSEGIRQRQISITTESVRWTRNHWKQNKYIYKYLWENGEAEFRSVGSGTDHHKYSY